MELKEGAEQSKFVTMATEQEIREKLGAALKRPSVTVLAEVKGVNQSDRTCDIDNDGVMIFGVRLQSITKGDAGVLVIPKIGSQALCVQIEDTDCFMLLHASEVESIELFVGDKTIAMDKDGFVFNGGTIGSVKADKMVEWMTKVYSDLQTLMVLLASFPLTTPAGPGTGSVVFNSQTPQPNLNDFVDDTLKH